MHDDMHQCHTQAQAQARAPALPLQQLRRLPPRTLQRRRLQLRRARQASAHIGCFCIAGEVPLDACCRHIWRHTAFCFSRQLCSCLCSCLKSRKAAKHVSHAIHKYAGTTGTSTGAAAAAAAAAAAQNAAAAAAAAAAAGNCGELLGRRLYSALNSPLCFN